MDFSSLTTSEAGALGGILGFAIGVLIFIALISLVISVLYIIGTWKMYKKAGEHGWAAIVPGYNLYVLMKIAKLPWFHFVIVLVLAVITGLASENETIEAICGIGIVVYSFVTYIRASKAFGKGAGFGVFTTFFPYIGTMILGFGSSKYEK